MRALINVLALAAAAISTPLFAQATPAAEEKAKTDAKVSSENQLDKFGFGPALYIVHDDKDVLKDSKDVSL